MKRAKANQFKPQRFHAFTLSRFHAFTRTRKLCPVNHGVTANAQLTPGVDANSKVVVRSQQNANLLCDLHLLLSKSIAIAILLHCCKGVGDGLLCEYERADVRIFGIQLLAPMRIGLILAARLQWQSLLLQVNKRAKPMAAT